MVLPYKYIAFCTVELPSCPVAANNCDSRFGTQFEGASTVGKCGAPCSSVRRMVTLGYSFLL
jgi:hypothetical protein